jgi:hypothetical protein
MSGDLINYLDASVAPLKCSFKKSGVHVGRRIHRESDRMSPACISGTTRYVITSRPQQLQIGNRANDEIDVFAVFHSWRTPFSLNSVSWEGETEYLLDKNHHR